MPKSDNFFKLWYLFYPQLPFSIPLCKLLGRNKFRNCLCPKSNQFSKLSRMHAQVDDLEVICFPSNFLTTLLSSLRNFWDIAIETHQKHPSLLQTKMIIFPITSHGNMSVMIVTRPIYAFEVPSRFDAPRHACILSLHPGSEKTRPNTCIVSMRLRKFLNIIAEADSIFISGCKFDSLNLPIFKPSGKLSYITINLFLYILT